VEIEIYSDVVCPWCYLGKRRLEAALAASPLADDVVLRWRAFQLDPTTPREGRPLISWLGPKFGGEDRARQTWSRVTALGAVEGIRIDFERAVIANTFDAHRLLWFADQPSSVLLGATADTQPELAEGLHRAHFTEGLDIGAHKVLSSVAASVGLDQLRVREMLASTDGTADVRAQMAQAQDLGITSVPTFIFAGKYAVTGAQDASTLAKVLAEVARREHLTPTVGTLVPQQRTAPAAEDDTRVS
jgi:predicted DsbA family dithiol-disulfide isomerase